MNRLVGIFVGMALVAFPAIASCAELSDRNAMLKIELNRPSGLGHARTYRDGANCKGISSPIGTGSWMPIGAGEPYTFLLSGASNASIFDYKYCLANVTFTPEPDAKYIAKFQFGDKTCKVVMVQVAESSADEGDAIEFVLRTYKAPLFSSGSWCGKQINQTP